MFAIYYTFYMDNTDIPQKINKPQIQYDLYKMQKGVINTQKIRHANSKMRLNLPKQQYQQVKQKWQQYCYYISNMNAILLYTQQKYIAKQLLMFVNCILLPQSKHSSPNINLSHLVELFSQNNNPDKNQLLPKRYYGEQGKYLTQVNGNNLITSLMNNEYRSQEIIMQNQNQYSLFVDQLHTIIRKLTTMIYLSGLSATLFTYIKFILQKIYKNYFKSIFYYHTNIQQQNQKYTNKKKPQILNKIKQIPQNYQEWKDKYLQKNKNILLGVDKNRKYKQQYIQLLLQKLKQQCEYNHIFTSQGQKQNYIQNINSYFSNNQLKQLKQSNCQKYLKNNYIQNHEICWNCITQVKKNSQLYLQRNVRQYYIMSKQESQNLLNKKKRDLFEQILCGILNKGEGYIFMGIRQQQIQIYKQFNKQTDNIKQNQIKTKLNQYIYTVINNESKNKIANKYKYIAEGLPIKCSTKNHRQLLIKQYIKQYISNYIRPQLDEQQAQNIFNLNNKQNKYIQISYIPVLSSRQINMLQNNQNGLFIIKIKIDLKQYKNNNKVYYVQQSNLDVNKKKYKICRNKNSYNLNIKLEDENIYTYIIQKYYKKFKQITPIHSKNIKCRKLQNLQMYEYDKIKQQQQIQKQKYKSMLNDEKPKYYDIKYQNVEINTDFQNQQKQKGLNHNKNPINMMSNQQNIQMMYGLKPIQIYKNNSLIIVSPTGMKQERSLLKQFLTHLDSQKIIYKCQQIYNKLPKISMRRIFYINHQQKFDLLKKIATNIDKQSRNLILVDARKQFDLKNPDFYYKAILQLNKVYKNVFPHSEYKVGSKQIQDPKDGKPFINYYFMFDTEEQAMFSFIVLDFQNIRAKFVNQSKAKDIQQLKIY